MPSTTGLTLTGLLVRENHRLDLLTLYGPLPYHACPEDFWADVRKEFSQDDYSYTEFRFLLDSPTWVSRAATLLCVYPDYNFFAWVRQCLQSKSNHVRELLL